MAGGLPIRSVLFDNLTADPAAPVEGQVWYNTTDSMLRKFNGTAVIDLCPTEVAEYGSLPAASFAVGPDDTLVGTVALTSTFANVNNVQLTACSNNGCVFIPNVSGAVTTGGFDIDLGTANSTDLIEVKYCVVGN